MAIQIFVSHTKDDKDFCDRFDVACARVGLKAFRSEFETIETPPWKTIKSALSRSIAMFLLVGNNFVTNQMYPSPDWKYTQNWIAYETGLACQRGIDVWVLCDDGVGINYPIPYFNNYAPFGISSEGNFKFMKNILKDYTNRIRYPTPIKDRFIVCPHNTCHAEFNLHAILNPGDTLTCPQCLNRMVFENGFLNNPSLNSLN